MVGRQNVLAQNVNLTLKPHKDRTLRIAWYTFWNDAERDALYADSGAAIRRNIGGSSGHDVGDELDITLDWKIDTHASLLLGWSHFWPGNFINSSGFSRDADYLYMQYLFRF